MAAAHRHTRCVSFDELERRIARTQQHLTILRTQFHQASGAVTAAERTLLARRAEREEVGLRLARLVDVLESLEVALAAERAVAHTKTRTAG